MPANACLEATIPAENPRRRPNKLTILANKGENNVACPRNPKSSPYATRNSQCVDIPLTTKASILIIIAPNRINGPIPKRLNHEPIAMASTPAHKN